MALSEFGNVSEIHCHLPFSTWTGKWANLPTSALNSRHQIFIRDTSAENCQQMPRSPVYPIKMSDRHVLVTLFLIPNDRQLVQNDIPPPSTEIRPSKHALLHGWAAFRVSLTNVSNSQSHSRSLTNLTCSMDTGIIGAVVVMEQFTRGFGSFSPVVHGLIISSILIPAAIASFLGDKLADWLGRPKSISVGALLFGAGAALEAGATHLAMFIVGRCIEGVGEGLYLGTLVV